MFQEILVICIILLSIAYVGYRLYGKIKRKEACEKCELMDAVKKQDINNKR